MLSVANFNNLNLNLNLRVFKDGNESIYFRAVDLARKLGYVNPQKAIRDHVSGENKVRFGDLRGERIVHPLGNQQMHEIILTEAGGYELLFRSNLPIARDFRKWMFEQVIPSIRLTGAYHLPGALPKFRAITDYDFELMMSDEQQTKEMRKEMDNKRDLIKDRKMADLGKIGGSVTQQRRRDMERKIEKQKDDIDDLKEEIETLADENENLVEENDRLFEDNETMSEEMTRLTYNESEYKKKIRGLESELDGLRNLAFDYAETLDHQTEVIRELETKINGTRDEKPENVELPTPNEEGL